MFNDLRHALRSLLKARAFSIVTVCTLALGIGAASATLGIVGAILLDPLPYAQPHELARIYTEFPLFASESGRKFPVSAAEYLDLKRDLKSWASLHAWTTGGANISTSGDPVRVVNSFVTGGLLQSLGVAPLLGRSLTPQDDQPGAACVTVISHGLWQRAFGGDRAVLERNILLDGRRCTIVGVMPQAFVFPAGTTDATGMWTPLQIDPLRPGPRVGHYFNVLGRLKPGITLAQARAELDAYAQTAGRTQSGHKFDPKIHPLVSYSLKDEVVHDARAALRVLAAAVAFLLLIACVSVANLLLARVEARQREIATSAALGASAWVIARRFMMEGAVLGVVGAAIGLLLAYAGLKTAGLADLGEFPRATEVAMDMRAIVLALAVIVIVSAVFAIAPLAHTAPHNLYVGMRSAAASTTGAGSAQRLRQLLIAGQLALTLVLLAGTGLMLRTFWNLQRVDAGFDPRGVATAALALPVSVYNRQGAENVWFRLEEQLNRAPGVESAALSFSLPPFGFRTSNDTEIEGPANAGGARYEQIDFNQVVSRDYFATLRIRVLEGRLFDERDVRQAPAVAIVNQAAARRFWGNESPLGRRVRPFGGGWYTVVGVIADVKNSGLDKAAGAELYLPYTQIPVQENYSTLLNGFYVAVRTRGELASAVRTIRREVSAIDPAVPLALVRGMDEAVRAARARPRFLTSVLTVFAGIALVLAAVGVYSVVSYSVARRTREFGIRMALGAERGAVLGLVLRQGMLLVACGMMAGLAGALVLKDLLSSLVYGIGPTDPATFVTVSLLMGAIALTACYFPAREAINVDPVRALRAE